MRLLSLFSGIGAFEKALPNIKLVNYCEIDKYASAAYSAIHGVSEDLNLWDVTKIDTDKLPDFDMVVFGFPCQDLSVAGNQAGMVEGTRSNLYWEAHRIIEAKRPRIIMFENVKNLVGKKFKEDFDTIVTGLEELGYTIYWKVLNAKHYGIPQNRERVYCIGVLGEHEPIVFPAPFDNGLRLKDLLEDEVDEKYYISDEKCQKLLASLKDKVKPKVNEVNQIGHMGVGGQKGGIYNQENIRPCLPATQYKDPTKIAVPVMSPDIINKKQNGRRIKEDGEPMFTLTGQDRHGVLQVGNIVETGNFDNPQRGRIYSSEGCSPSLNTVGGGGLEPKILEDFYSNRDVRIFDDCPTLRADRQGLKVLQQYRIRKLTPKECWRLQGFSDEDFEKARLRLMEQFYKGKDKANSQLYKMAGNSIVVAVLEEFFKANSSLFN